MNEKNGRKLLELLTKEVINRNLTNEIKLLKKFEENTDTVSEIKIRNLLFTQIYSFELANNCDTNTNISECIFYKECTNLLKTYKYYERYVHFMSMQKINKFGIQSGGYGMLFLVALVCVGTSVVNSFNIVPKDLIANSINAEYGHITNYDSNTEYRNIIGDENNTCDDLMFSKAVSLYNTDSTCQYQASTYFNEPQFSKDLALEWQEDLSAQNKVTGPPTKSVGSIINMTPWRFGIGNAVSSSYAKAYLSKIKQSIDSENPNISKYIVNTVAEYLVIDANTNQHIDAHVFNILYEPTSESLCIQDLNYAYTKTSISNNNPWSFSENKFWEGTSLQGFSTISLQTSDNVFGSYSTVIKNGYPSRNVKVAFRFENPDKPTNLGYGCLTKKECEQNFLAVDKGITGIYKTYEENIKKTSIKKTSTGGKKTKRSKSKKSKSKKHKSKRSKSKRSKSKKRKF